MRTIAVATILLAMTLAGCADSEPSEPTDSQPPLDAGDDHNGTVDVKQIVATLAIENTTVSSGVPFNVSIDATVQSTGNSTNGTSDNATDLSQATWQVRALAVNGTGNETPIILNGTGIPVVTAINITGNGTYTLAVVVSATGHEPGSAELVITVISVMEELPPMEPIVLTGTVTGMWAGVYIGDADTQKFTIDRVPEVMHVRVEWGTTSWDMDFDLLAPDGAEALSVANFNDPALGDGNSYEEGTLTDVNHLAKLGEWSLVVIPAGAVDGDYTATISFTA